MMQLIARLPFRGGSSSLNIPLHPSIPMKLSQKAAHSTFAFSSNNTLQRQSTTLRNQKQNVARLYARHCIELASLSAVLAGLSKTATSKMEASSLLNQKPSEWGRSSVEEFLERKRRFGDELSAQELGNTKFQRVFAASRRILHLSLLATPLFVLVPASYLSENITHTAWKYGLWSAEKAGPTCIKFLQWASTRSDLFPAEFCLQFSKLQASTRGHTWKETEATLRNNLGPNYEEFIEFPSTSPIGSGCIAQVYHGRLNRAVGLFEKNSEVAVKIQHPNIVEKVCIDFYLLNKMATLIEKIPYLNLDYLSMKDSVQQFRDVMLPQLDLRCEARNLNRFRKNFKGDDQIAFPAPITELTCEEILIESFVHGLPVMEYMKPEHAKKDREEIATIGLKATMQMIFLHDFVHGDLHPGNIIIDKNEDGQIRMNMIDCGLVVEMGEREHKNLTSILGALIKKDGNLAGNLMVDTARKCEATDMDVKLFCEGLARICADDEENNFLEKVGDYLAEICYLACKHKVKLEAAFINAALACEIMEGIASSLYPEMEVQHVAMPMVVKAELMHGIKGFSFGNMF